MKRGRKAEAQGDMEKEVKGVERETEMDREKFAMGTQI